MILYGASGHAKVIIDILKQNNVEVERIYDDDLRKKEILGIKVFQYSGGDKREMIISIGNNKTRKQISEKIQVAYGKAVHPKTVVDQTVKIKEGTVVMAGVVINSSSEIGKHCIINTSSSVDHDCLLEDFVHISPHATLCGGIKVGEGTHIGAGVVVIPNITIGKWCTIGAGAVIIKDVPDGVTVVGNPGRIIDKL